MILRLRFFLYFVLFAFILSSCEKELSYEGGGIPAGPGTAIYTFSGGTSSCTGAVVNGTYTAGIATSSSNTVKLEVMVDSTGTYNISIPSVNGISFSGSGTFTTEGLQNITLIASGTPTASGNFNFKTSASGCSFSVTVAPGGGGSGGTAVYTFDGGSSTCTGAVINGIFTAGTALTSSNTVTLGVNVTTAGTYTISTAATDGITFSSAGTFAATGAQTITLTASGTPTAAGDFNFTAGSSGCTFSVTVAPGSSSATDFVRCKIDGVDKTFNDGPFAIDLFGISLTINGTANAASANPANFSITLSNLTTLTIVPGTYTIDLLGNNCLIGYIPDASSSGTGWGSATAGQSGGFTVVLTENSATRVSGTFSGTLYDNDGNGTNSKTVTNGEFSVPK